MLVSEPGYLGICGSKLSKLGYMLICAQKKEDTLQWLTSFFSISLPHASQAGSQTFSTCWHT